MGFDLDGDGQAQKLSHIGCMPYTVYRIHDTTNHLFIICLSFVYQFIQQFIYNLFIICLSYSSVVVLLFNQSIIQYNNHQSLLTHNFTTKYFVLNLSLSTNLST